MYAENRATYFSHPKKPGRIDQVLTTTVAIAEFVHPVIPLIAVATLAIEASCNLIDKSSSKNAVESSRLVGTQPEFMPMIQVEEGISILPGFVDIKPEVNIRTSPHIDKAVHNLAQIPAAFRGETIRVYNPQVVAGAKADPLARTSSDRVDPHQGTWITFQLDGQQVYVSLGSATKDFVDHTMTRELTPVKRIKSGKASYYEGPGGQGFVDTHAEVAPVSTPDE